MSRIVNAGLRVAVGLFALSLAAWSHAAAPLIDNERVTVWDTTSALPPAQHDFVAVPLYSRGTATFGHQGDIPSKEGLRTIVIELKEPPAGPIPNNTGLPLAFPRPHAKKLLENDRVIVWDYLWRPNAPTPMHFHDKDAVVVSEANGAVQSTTADGKTTVSQFTFGKVWFNLANRSHSELLLSGKGRAVIVELK